jgi:coenzyme F420-0:L-glutamate ligase/coenzyme F420-1:gamma-L-glutamate ligase
MVIPDLPRVKPGDDLAAMFIEALERADPLPQTNDIFVVAQKIVSKAEGRYVDLNRVTPSSRAVDLAEHTEKDPRLIEVILTESSEVLRYRPGLIVVRHRLGFVMANAGIDQSNIDAGVEQNRVLLLPTDPDGSAAQLKVALDRHFGVRVGVVISDSVGRAWRVGTVGLALGAAGLPAVRDLRGQCDLYGRALQSSESGFADMVASSALLLMGEAGEGMPIVRLRGLLWSDTPTPGAALIRPREQDLFG